MGDQATGLHNSTVPSDEVLAELETLLRSPIFERSDRLQRFLRYIVELTLNGEAARINEYLIGSEVFRKGQDYNPNEDSVVRRQAHSLRQKLQEYYAHEGADHAVRIELPVGRYVPVFRRIEKPQPEPAPAAPEPVSPPPSVAEPVQQRRSRPWLMPAAAAGLFLLGLATGQLWHGSAAATTTLEPATKAIWGPWLDGGEAFLCFSNPMSAYLRRFDRPVTRTRESGRVAASPELEASARRMFGLPPGGILYVDPARNQAKMGEAIAGVHLAQLFARGAKPLQVAQSRFLSWDDVRSRSLILLGNVESNPWVESVLKGYPFHLAPTIPDRPRGIVNVKPGPGEPAIYQTNYHDEDNEADEEYALVSMLPGLNPGQRFATISGLNTHATQMAAEYMSSEQTLRDLLGRLQKEDPSHTGPWKFQAVLKTEVHDNVPTRCTLVTLRVLR